MITAQKLTRGTTAPHAYASLRQDVLTGRLAPGDLLIESLLADRYNVSRTPVREALRRLEHEGFINRGPRGLEVRRYAADELWELYEARALLEGYAARRAAERHGPGDARLIEEFHARMAALDEDAGVESRIAANSTFHTAVWKAARNRTLQDVLSGLHLHGRTTLAMAPRLAEAVAEHARVVDAILRRDADEAERCMVAHLERGRDLAVLLQGGDDFT